MTHANRSKARLGTEANPTVEDLVAFRERFGITQAEAAKLAMSSLRSWLHWEQGERRMHPAIWAWVQHAAANGSESSSDAGDKKT